MSTAMIIEAVGYIGSALVVISMLMSSVVRLRIVNSVGARARAPRPVLFDGIRLASSGISPGIHDRRNCCYCSRRPR